MGGEGLPMIVKDNSGRIIADLQHIRDSRGNSFDSLTTYYNGRPVTQQITVRDTQGKVESKTILAGKLIP